ncbi:hypothetical protein CLV94_0647 [Flavobacterium endophyticum]|uniref:Uncharacterized protein n=1 Tax=Flavobacterium endophyticum TaxID=1540163 RepID=A0A495MMK0_9FLAO|nr:hypothetical protein CLV94_0647 [Flavobacterium endophyticum]
MAFDLHLLADGSDRQRLLIFLQTGTRSEKRFRRGLGSAGLQKGRQHHYMALN